MIDLAIAAVLHFAPGDVAPCDPEAPYATPDCPNPWPDDTNVTVCMAEPDLCTPTDIPAAPPALEIVIEPSPDPVVEQPAPVVAEPVAEPPGRPPQVDLVALVREFLRAIFGSIFS